MKFVILKDKIIESLNTVSKAISGRNAVPSLNGIRLELNQSGLYLTGTDNYITIVTKVPSKDTEGNDIISVFEPGVCLLGQKNIIDILRGMEDKEISFETIEENVIKVTDSSSNYSLNCMDPSDYPYIELQSEGSTFNIECSKLVEAIDQTAFAAAEKDGRPVLTGVNLFAHGNVLDFVATDIYRIAKKTIELPQQLSFNTTIPAKTLNDVSSIAENEEKVQITVNDKKTTFKFENTVVIARVINGMYPDTSKLVPTEFKSFLSVNSANIINAIDRVTKISIDKKDAVRMSLSTYNAEVSTRSQEGGSAKVALSFESYSGEQLDVSFMPRYVLEAVKALKCETVEIEFNGDAKPFVVRRPSDNSSIQLILPMRTY